MVRRNQVSINRCAGTELIDAQDNTVTSDVVFDSTGCEGLGQGVFLIYSHLDRIERNTTPGNQLGVVHYESSFVNTTRRNRLFANSEDGITAIDKFTVLWAGCQ